MNVPRTISKLFGWSVIANIVSLAGITYFAGQLGSAGIGSFFLFQSLIQLAALAGGFGINIGVEKEIGRGRPVHIVFPAALVIVAGILVVMGVVLFFTAPYLDSYLGVSVVPVLFLGIVLRQLFAVLQSALRGAQLVEETAVFSALRKIVWIVGGIGFLEGGYSVRAPIYSSILGLLCVVGIAVYRLRPRMQRPELADVRSVASVAKWAWISSVGGAVYNWMDVTLLGVFLGPAAVGVYEVVWRVASATLLFTQAVRRTAFPRIVRAGGNADFASVEALITRFMTPSLYFVLPGFVGTLVVGRELLGIVFGPEFAAGGLILVILMVEKIQRAVSVVLIGPVYAIDREDIDAKSTAAGIVSNLILNLALIPVFGIVGAAVATMLSETLNFGIHAWCLRKYVSLRIPWREIGSCLGAAGIMGIVIWGVKLMYPVETIVSLTAVIGLAIVTYVSVTAFDPVLRSKGRSSIASVLNTEQDAQ